jgi:hypothetical protein
MCPPSRPPGGNERHEPGDEENANVQPIHVHVSIEDIIQIVENSEDPLQVQDILDVLRGFVTFLGGPAPTISQTGRVFSNRISYATPFRISGSPYRRYECHCQFGK